MAVRIQDYWLEIQNTVVVVLIFLRHNGGWVIGSFQLCFQSIACVDFRAHVTSFVCTLCAQLQPQFVKVWLLIGL